MNNNTENRQNPKLVPRAFAAGALAGFLFLLLVSEVFCRWEGPHGFWYERFDFSGCLVHLPEIEERASYYTSLPGGVALLGDSVLGAGALTEHRIHRARQRSLTACLERAGSARRKRVFSLGADGLLLPDLEALSNLLRNRSTPPPPVVLVLNFRMFAPEFTSGPKALSRDFLRSRLDSDLVAGLGAGSDPSLARRMEDAAARHWVLFRTTQLLKCLWYFPTQKDFFQRLLEKVVKPGEEDDLAQAALKMKILPYYGPQPWSPRDLPFKSLDRLVDRIALEGRPLLVVLTPQNRKYLEPELDVKSFRANRKRLADFFASRRYPSLRYLDWADRLPPDQFLDHCHLTPEGNEILARDLMNALSGGTP